MKRIYREELLEIYANKENFGELKNKTHEVRHKNPVCNDEIIIDLEVKKGKIIDAKFRGVTCFVSTISASVLIGRIKGKRISEIKKISKKDLDEMIGVDITPTRIKCELLPLEALKKIKC